MYPKKRDIVNRGGREGGRAGSGIRVMDWTALGRTGYASCNIVEAAGFAERNSMNYNG
jgi:hypothetical protein